MSQVGYKVDRRAQVELKTRTSVSPAASPRRRTTPWSSVSMSRSWAHSCEDAVARARAAARGLKPAMPPHARGLHSFTLKLNMSNSRTHS